MAAINAYYNQYARLADLEKKGLLAGLWEFPNVPGDKLPEEWELAPEMLTHTAAGKHIFTHIEWHMSALSGELPSPRLPEGWVWADRAALRDRYAVPNAFKFVEEAVEQRLGHF